MGFGDILIRQDGAYRHFAMEGPFGRAIEYTKRFGTPRVMLTTVDSVVAGGGTTTRHPYPADARFTADIAWARLMSRLGEQKYSVTENNCESLINWAIYDNNHSPQGQELAAVGKVAVGVAALCLLVAVLEG